MKVATVFGASELEPYTNEYQEGIKLGVFLAQSGYVVKCGGYYGLMEAVSKGVRKAGGTCIGITNTSFDPKLANQFITEERKARDLFDRLRFLIEDTSVFVAQVGSLGTLTELLSVWCLVYTGSIASVRICLVGETWQEAINGLRVLPIKPEHFNLIEIYPNVESFFSSFTNNTKC